MCTHSLGEKCVCVRACVSALMCACVCAVRVSAWTIGWPRNMPGSLCCDLGEVPKRQIINKIDYDSFLDDIYRTKFAR